jgi:hypothetical protein
MIEERSGISVQKYLGFGDFLSKHKEESDGTIEIGEFNNQNNLHGRGVRIQLLGDISMGFWNNHWISVGNHIRTYADGNFKLGRYFLADDLKRYEGTRYKSDGTCEPWYT